MTSKLFPLVTVGSIARFLALAMLAVHVPVTGAPIPGKPLPGWERGMLDIHQINTGTGNSAFFVLPDGTTVLVDAAAGYREAKVTSRYDAPQRPSASLRPGQWIARYVRRMHPEGAGGVLDYAVLTHFHEDHIGALTVSSPKAAAKAYRLTGITDVAEEVRIRKLIDRGWPTYDYPAPLGGEVMLNYQAFVKWQSENRGLQVERFQPGRAEQIVLLRARQEFPKFEVRNLAANGYAWTGTGTVARNRFPSGAVPSENNCSLAFRLTYGAFAYFNGADLTGLPSPNAPVWSEMESAVAWACGPVDVAVVNHHGSPANVANAFFLSVLQPRIHIISIYAASQPGPDVLRRLLSDHSYPGPREVFMTNWLWPGRREHMVKLYGETDATWLVDQINQIASNQGHVLVRVDPGGAHYRVIVIDDSRDDGSVLSVFGPYESRSSAAPGGVSDSQPMPRSGSCRLTGLTRISESLRIGKLLDRGWPDCTCPTPVEDAATKNSYAHVQWQVANNGMKVEHVPPGGGEYRVVVVDDSSESHRGTRVFGPPFTSQ